MTSSTQALPSHQLRRSLFKGYINGRESRILLDSGADISLMSLQTMTLLGLRNRLEHDTSPFITLANGIGKAFVGYVMALFQMELQGPQTDPQIWVVSNQIVQDGKIIFGTPFTDLCDSVSIKPRFFEWLGTSYKYGINPPAQINSVALDTEFKDDEEIDKYFVPYLPVSINAAQDADISPHLSQIERQAVISLIQDFEDCFSLLITTISCLSFVTTYHKSMDMIYSLPWIYDMGTDRSKSLSGVDNSILYLHRQV